MVDNIISWMISFDTTAGRPGLGTSSSPGNPFSIKDVRQWITVGRDTPRVFAIMVLDFLSEAIEIIFALKTILCGKFLVFALLSNSCRSTLDREIGDGEEEIGSEVKKQQFFF